MAEAWPVILLGDQLSCFINFEIPCERIIVVTTYHLGTDDFWDVWKASVLKHSLDVFPFIPHPLCLGFLDEIVLFLQFLQAEPHSTNASGVGALVSQFGPKSVPELTQLREDMSFTYEDLVER